MPMKHKNGGRVTGCVKIYPQGNDYEKVVIELVGEPPVELTSAPQIHLIDPTMDPLEFEGGVLHIIVASAPFMYASTNASKCLKIWAKQRNLSLFYSQKSA